MSRGILRPIPDDFVEVCDRLKLTHAVARHYKCGQTALYRWAAEAGVVFKAPSLPMPDDLAANARTMGVMSLARHYGRSRETINRWLRKAGIEPVSEAAPPRPALRLPAPDDFAEMAKNMCRAELKRHYGVCYDVVNRWIREAGIAPAGYVHVPKTKPRPYHCSTRTDGGRGHNIAFTRTYTAYDLAADDLRRAGWAVYHCDDKGRADPKGKFWRVGNVVCDGDELLVRADRARKRAA